MRIVYLKKTKQNNHKIIFGKIFFNIKLQTVFILHKGTTESKIITYDHDLQCQNIMHRYCTENGQITTKC